MALFGRKKEEGRHRGSPCDGGGEKAAEAAPHAGASVTVLGSGCKKCDELEANAKAALTQLGLDVAVDHVTDFAQIAAFGVMTTPALMIDGRVVSYGKVAKTEEIVKLLQARP